MRYWIITVLSLFCTVTIGQESSCPKLTLYTDPAINSYRLNGGKCTNINKGTIEVEQDSRQLTFFGVSKCRTFPTLPNSCDIQIVDLQNADGNGNCEVGIKWTFIPQRGATCNAIDH